MKGIMHINKRERKRSEAEKGSEYECEVAIETAEVPQPLAATRHDAPIGVQIDVMLH
jgi:hypothetical protein